MQHVRDIMCHLLVLEREEGCKIICFENSWYKLVLNDEWFQGRVAIMSKNQSDMIPNEGSISLGTTQHAWSLEML